MGTNTNKEEYAYAKTTDVGAEKHVPFLRTIGSMVHVNVGSTPHPMEEDHYIEWIELWTNFDTYRKHLKPGEAPQAIFELSTNEYVMDVYAYCNVHGLWLLELPRHVKTSGCMGELVDWHSSR